MAVTSEGEAFRWWCIYGPIGERFAVPYEDSREVRRLVDANPYRWFGTIEGAILHGGVIATAIKRTREPTYSSAHYLATGQYLCVGEIMVTEITAEPVGFPTTERKRYESGRPGHS